MIMYINIYNFRYAIFHELIYLLILKKKDTAFSYISVIQEFVQ